MMNEKVVDYIIDNLEHLADIIKPTYIDYLGDLNNYDVSFHDSIGEDYDSIMLGILLDDITKNTGASYDVIMDELDPSIFDTILFICERDITNAKI